MDLKQDLLNKREEIQKLRKLIKDCNHQISVYKDEMQTILTEIPTEQLTRSILNDLYWNFPEIKVLTLAKIKNTSQPKFLKNEIDPLPLLKCSACGYITAAISRDDISHIKQSHEKGSLRCPSCDPLPEFDYGKVFEDNKKRLTELQKMPYQEYLKTPEWNETRKAHLKRSGYKCQLCNKGNAVLNVHHRTYERKGSEWARDLIALCEDCHKIFHENRKLH